MMKKLLFLFSGLLGTGMAQAQLLKVSYGSSLTILGGTIFSVDSLTLIPSADYSLSNTTLSKSDTAIHTPVNTCISRVYQFSGITNPYSGSVQINYTDGAELNGIPENLLTLNIYNGTSWNAYTATTRDVINNFVFTSDLNAVTLNELTLADTSNALPLVWLSFTATKQGNSVLLQWATMQDQNTRNFIVQYSSDGINWTNIGTLPATGSPSSANNYSYVHTSPVTGINYYRILQTDKNYRYSCSVVKMVLFTKADIPFIIIGNPVTNGLLTVQVNNSTTLALYSIDGKLVWLEKVNAGIQHIDVSRYAKGTYLVKTDSYTQKFELL